MCNKTNKQVQVNSFIFSFVEKYKNCEIYFSEDRCAFFTISSSSVPKEIIYWCSNDGIKFSKDSEDYKVSLSSVRDQIDLQNKK